jgi:rod shape-determining protein MreC
MFTGKRWWERYGTQALWVAGTIGVALLLRHTKAAVFTELYQLVSRPFQGQPTAVDQLANAQFTELQQRLVELQSQNQRLQELLGFMEAMPSQGTAAPVIGRTADHWWQQVTLGRGSQDGIEPDQIVMAPGGVVGRVDSVTPHTSRVLLISDPSSSIGVMVSRSRATGYMRGRGNNRAAIEFFEKSPDVRKGDPIAISNLSHKYPAGLSVGRVESVNMDKMPAPEAIVELSAPISSLEWVLVYATPPSFKARSEQMEQTEQTSPASPPPAASSSTAPSPSPLPLGEQP